MQFRVVGAELTVKSIEFSDALATNDHAIQQSAAELIGKPFSRSTVELFEFEQVRPVYLAHAFLHVQFGPPSARVASGSPQPASDGVVIVAPIVPGPAYKWGGGLWVGNSVIPVSYTHLDVYKRQAHFLPASFRTLPPMWALIG